MWRTLCSLSFVKVCCLFVPLSVTAKQVEFLTIINRVSQCTANRSNSKTNLPHNELLIQPLLLQASYWVLWLPVPQYKNTIIPLRVDACNETAQLLPLAGGDLNSQQALKSSQHGHRQQKSKHYLSGLCTKSCPATAHCVFQGSRSTTLAGGTLSVCRSSGCCGRSGTHGMEHLKGAGRCQVLTECRFGLNCSLRIVSIYE